MSNPQGQGRRSSMAANPQVQEELRNIVPHDVFKTTFSEYNLTNMTRLSGNSLRGSIPRRTTGSGIPTLTPLSAIGSVGAASSVSRGMSASFAGRIGPLPKGKPISVVPTSTSSLSRSKSSVPVRSKPPQGSKNSLLRTATTGLMNTRRKSKSHETLSFLQTPSAYTPARSRSKSPGIMSTSRKRGLQNDSAGGDVGKCIIATKDRKVMAEMSKFVFDFLESQNCPSRPMDLKEFIVNPTRLASAKYVGMVKFLSSYFGADSFFSYAKGEKVDDEEKIIEFAKLLKYPSTLSKSHLKTPTVQHAWPGSLAFLTWLCCRTLALITPVTERNNICQLSENGLQEIAFESYLTLFPLHFRNQLTPEHIEAEMDNFKLRVRDTHAAEITKTKEELIEEKNTRLAELECLNNEPDPAKEVRGRLNAEMDALKALNAKIHDIENECKKYSNHNHLKLTQEGIQLELKTKTAELKRLKQQVEKQPLSNQKASEMKGETETLKKQLESSRHINMGLKKDYELRHKKLEEFQREFYELCKAFGIVERYNENLRFLRLEDYSIPPNPFAPKELEEWMKSVSKNLQRSQGRVNEMLKEVTASSEQKEKEYQQLSQKMKKMQKEIDDLNQKLQSVEKYSEFIKREYEQQWTGVQAQLDEVHAELCIQEEKMNKKEEEKEAALRNLNECKQRLETHRKLVEEHKTKLDEGVAKYTMFVAELDQFVHDMLIRAATSQQAFYTQHFGVNIFEGLQLENMNVGILNNNNE